MRHPPVALMQERMASCSMECEVQGRPCLSLASALRSFVSCVSNSAFCDQTAVVPQVPSCLAAAQLFTCCG